MAAGSVCELTYADRYCVEELKVIHHQDREAFVRLIRFFNSDSSIKVIAFFKWLELRSLAPVVHRVVSDTDDQALFHLATEVTRCLIYLYGGRQFDFQLLCLPKVVCGGGFSLAFLQKNRHRAIDCVEWFVKRVYRRVFRDYIICCGGEDLPVEVLPPPLDLQLYSQVAGELPGLGSLHLKPDSSGSVLISFSGSGVIELKPPIVHVSAQPKPSKLAAKNPCSAHELMPVGSEKPVAARPIEARRHWMAWRERAVMVPRGFVSLLVWVAAWIRVFMNLMSSDDSEGDRVEH